MRKLNKGIVIVIALLVLAVIVGQVIKIPDDITSSVNTNTSVDTKKPVDTETSVITEIPVKEQLVAGLLIEFENETTEQEVKTILEDTNVPVAYNIEYNSDISEGRNYAKVEKDKK